MAALIGVATAPATAAQTKGLIYPTITGPELAAVMQRAGYRAELATHANGNPEITSSASGLEFYVNFYGCDQSEVKECESIELYIGFDFGKGYAVESVNQWNRENRFSIAYLDHEDDPFLTMNINVAGGVTAEMLVDCLNTWSSQLGEFKTFIDW
jgi:hypothetical protein